MDDRSYDLEERTFQYAKRVALYCKTLPRSISNDEYRRQLVRASGSVGANYIEATELKKIFSSILIKAQRNRTPKLQLLISKPKE